MEQQCKEKMSIVLKNIAFGVALILGAFVLIGAFNATMPPLIITLIITLACSIFYEWCNMRELDQTQKRFVVIKLTAIWIAIIAWYLAWTWSTEMIRLVVSACAFSISIGLCVFYLINGFRKKTDGRAASVITCLLLTLGTLWFIVERSKAYL